MPIESAQVTQASPGEVPIAYATPWADPPIDNGALAKLTASFAGQTVGQRYQGPGWVSDTGIAFVVLIAHDEKAPRRVRTEGGCAFLTWRWNNTPSVPLSLTLVVRNQNPKPHVRWMRSSDDSVVAAIRREGRFLVTVANSKGQHSGWFEASYHRGEGSKGPSFDAPEKQWQFETPGIPYSSIHERFDPNRRESYNEWNADEIPVRPMVGAALQRALERGPSRPRPCIGDLGLPGSRLARSSSRPYLNVDRAPDH